MAPRRHARALAHAPLGGGVPLASATLGARQAAAEAVRRTGKRWLAVRGRAAGAARVFVPTAVAGAAVAKNAGKAGAAGGAEGKAEKKQARPWKHAAAGALSGALSRTCVAPLERAKVELMVDPTRGSLAAVLSRIAGREGVRGLFRGNTLNVARIAPTKAVEYVVWEKFKRHKLKGNRASATLTSRERILGGSLASVVGTFVTHPIDTVRTRATIGRGAGASPAKLASTLWRSEGPRGFFRGLAPNLLRVAPYGAVNYGVYDFLASAYRKARASRGLPPPAPGGLENALWGGLSGAMAQTTVYPLEMLQRRIQASAVSGSGGRAAIAALAAAVRQHGIGALYAGIGANYCKTIPAAAIGWWSYAALAKAL